MDYVRYTAIVSRELAVCIKIHCREMVHNDTNQHLDNLLSTTSDSTTTRTADPSIGIKLPTLSSLRATTAGDHREVVSKSTDIQRRKLDGVLASSDSDNEPSPDNPSPSDSFTDKQARTLVSPFSHSYKDKDRPRLPPICGAFPRG
ncbi:hypothetical protein LOTGIDRAFT_174632 [Lottia gigantea]|uniref:Uncharacterized protein n=1 Tax=Lottia gigantea TaxID=225164 RepID=V3ZZX9_LOTGI|nr:hypothetical protein LOTGIDRAFT_174632 [Lottia gigantea]ESO97108.1 hypothetical protein LOTGIDRAFT_174632 [Lottia gigantea]